MPYQPIGIIACSADGAALCYLTLCREGVERAGSFDHPEIVIHTLPPDDYLRCVESGKWALCAELLAESARILARAGSAFAIIPDNTVHQAFDLYLAHKPLPTLHIADPVVAEAARRHFRVLGLLGSRSLAESTVYATKLAPIGVSLVLPDPDDQARMDRIIYQELLMGQFLPESRAFVLEVLDRMKNRGCDAVLLGNIEIVLLIEPGDGPLPVLDTTRLLARAALRQAWIEEVKV
jgi:aspartate racemase